MPAVTISEPRPITVECDRTLSLSMFLRDVEADSPRRFGLSIAARTSHQVG